ncbi:ATP-binding protein [Streptomyces sp. NPDC007861]|uniref:ATP-binding protein n=1 Tax=Streptomyces sp. NPDC007861 TaxID=3154893 RepID=UPI0033CCBA7C
MDPNNRDPEEYGHDTDRFDEGDDTAAGVSRPPRDALPELGQKAAAPARTVRLVSGDFLLTVNPVDGSEIEPCPPGERPSPPARHTAEQREELRRAAQPPAPAGPAAPPLPLLEREEERERLLRLLGRGRSVRLTGPAGSGRTTLLDIVAADCADLAPDGVVRLSGHHRTPTELLYELLAAVHRVPQHRPDRAGLLELVRGIGAVVLVDDLEFGGSALDELLAATPECAFLLAATPDVVAPSPDSHLEEVFLQGLGRSATLELLERAVERPLTDEESNWAGDLWFESEGLPLRFVQAGALLRQRDALRIPDPDPVDEDDENVFADGHDAPLPTLGEGAAPAALLASRLSESAREALRFAVALGGEMPHQAHLPALVGDTHADAALGELTSCGLLTPVGSRYRLASGVATQLEAEGYGEDAVARARTAAQHYAWWTGHPSVAAERAAAEADAVLAAMTALVPGSEAGHPSAAVLLARSAAPAFAAGLHWGAWERVLRTGQEAARIAGEVAEEAYFHHELGVLALCAGNLDRARAELEASIALRGALADKGGTVAGRRALALVTDRESTAVAAEAVPVAPTPPAGVPAAVAPPTEPLVTHQDTPPPAALLDRLRRTVLTGTRRNVAAAGAGALLVAVLGTVVTLGATAGNDEPADQVTNEQSATENDGDSGDGLTAEQPSESPTRSPSPTKSAPDRSTAPSASAPGAPDDSSTSGGGGSTTTGGNPAPTTSGGTGTSPTPTTSGSTTTSPSPTSSGTSSPSPTSSGTSSPPTTGTPSSSGTTTTGTSGETSAAATGETAGGPTTGGTTGSTTDGAGGGTTSGGTTSGGTTG